MKELFKLLNIPKSSIMKNTTGSMNTFELKYYTGNFKSYCNESTNIPSLFKLHNINFIIQYQTLS